MTRLAPSPLAITPYALARQFLGLRETPGADDTAAVVAMLQLAASWAESDETPWCSAFVGAVQWLLGQPRSKSLAARSWLRVGEELAPAEAAPGFDVVILSRGSGKQPGPEVIAAPGHVGYFVRWTSRGVTVLGGNQGNAVSEATFPRASILGIRRCYAPATR
jgi:uncharacterized protein (TIGR02594 family)